MHPVRLALRSCSILLLLFLVVFAGVNCGDDATAGGADAGAAAATALTVTPPVLSLAAGTSSALQATLTLTDSTTQDVTNAAAWSSSAPAIATVAGGKVSALAVGTATITATSGTLTKTVAVTVTSATLVSLNLTPAAPTLAKGLTKPLVATGTFSDNTTQNLTDHVAWTSATATVATVDKAGLLTAVGPGNSKISATLGTVVGTTMATITDAEVVSIAVTPPNPTVPTGVTKQLSATATMTDNTTEDLTTQATWTTSAPSNASIVATTGVAKGVAKGSATITATFKGIAGSTLLTVTDAQLVAIGVTPATPSIAKGLIQNFVATGTYSDATTQDITTQVTWASTVGATATISNAAGSQGHATALDLGVTTISATSGAISNSTTLTVTAATLVSIGVTPAAPSVAKGLPQQLTATGVYTDASTQDLTTTVTWASSDLGKATISNAAGSNGLASTVGVGSTTISATLGAVSGNTTLTVTAATLVSIAVTPATPSVAKGLTQQLTATGTYTDGSAQDLTTTVTWASADPTKATISNAAGSKGLASTVAVGSTVISATLGAVSSNTTLTVTAATLVSIAVTPAAPSVALGLTKQFVATGTYTDASTVNLTTTATWASSDPTKATISNAAGSNGLASTAGVGPTTISATIGAVSGSTTLTVTPATLVSIAVTPATPLITTAHTLQFTATGTFTDASTQDLTTTVTWASTDPTRATISNAAGSKGLATATMTLGDTTISATSGAIVGSTVATVVNMVPFSANQTIGGKVLHCGAVDNSHATYTECTGLDVGGKAMINYVFCGPAWSSSISPQNDLAGLCQTILGAAASKVEVYYDVCGPSIGRVRWSGGAWVDANDNGQSTGLRCYY